jgi:transposase
MSETPQRRATDHKTVSAAQAAEMLEVSPSTIARMVKRKELTGYKLRPDLSNSPLRITAASIQALIDRRKLAN